jgi:hypothetical protein
MCLRTPRALGSSPRPRCWYAPFSWGRLRAPARRAAHSPTGRAPRLPVQPPPDERLGVEASSDLLAPAGSAAARQQLVALPWVRLHVGGEAAAPDRYFPSARDPPRLRVAGPRPLDRRQVSPHVVAEHAAGRDLIEHAHCPRCEGGGRREREPGTAAARRSMRRCAAARRPVDGGHGTGAVRRASGQPSAQRRMRGPTRSPARCWGLRSEGQVREGAAWSSCWCGSGWWQPGAGPRGLCPPDLLVLLLAEEPAAMLDADGEWPRVQPQRLTAQAAQSGDGCAGWAGWVSQPVCRAPPTVLTSKGGGY